MSLVYVEYHGSQVNIGSGYGLVEQMIIGSGYGLLQQDVTLVEVDPDLCRYIYNIWHHQGVLSPSLANIAPLDSSWHRYCLNVLVIWRVMAGMNTIW